MNKEQFTIELSEDEAALVVGKNREVQFYLPKLDEDENVPQHVMYLTALAVLTQNDDEFVKSVLDKFYGMMEESENVETVKAHLRSGTETKE
jgi:hypothetical protein